MSHATLARIPAPLLVATLFACGGDLSLPTASANGVVLSIVDGDGQQGTVGEPLPEPLVVSVASGDTPIAGHQVAFSIAGAPAGARVQPDTAVTDEDGRASAEVVLGPATGEYEIEATLVVTEPQPPPSTVFVAEAVPGEPDTVRAASPLNQPGRRGQPVPESPTVIVVDRFGNPVPDAEVKWDVTVGGGEVSGGETTDSEGKAVATWTLGNGVGLQKLVARVDGAHGSPVTFSAVVLF